MRIDLRSRLEAYFNRQWYERERPAAGWRLGETVYRRAARLWQERPALPVAFPVIVVGNLTAGGSGKTPVVAALVRQLRHDGRRVAVISRGYRAAGRQRPLRVHADSSVQACGDEPVFLARHCSCPVWVGRDRSLTLAAARGEGADVVIADDGLQNRQLPRSFEICVIDGRRGIGNGHLLPAGPLRQPLARLESVDLVLIKHAGKPSDERSLPVSGAHGFALKPVALRALAGGPARPPESLQGQVVDAVCGIANPDGFRATLEALGATVRLHPFADHHAWRASDLAGLEGPVVTTAKDAVKLAGLSGLPPVSVLEVAAELPSAVRAAVQRHVREFRGVD